MSKAKVHLYINPMTGSEVCVRRINPDELYRWEPYKREGTSTVSCTWCCRRLKTRKVKEAVK